MKASVKIVALSDPEVHYAKTVSLQLIPFYSLNGSFIASIN